MPRYVLLEHDYPHLHWDLMLEASSVLLTWRLERPPTPGADLAAERLPDHRLPYLDYEGPVSGDRGRVTRWDAGTFTWIEAGGPALTAQLAGGRLRGTLRLEETRGGWRALFEEGGNEQ
jgi:hypothetical protein